MERETISSIDASDLFCVGPMANQDLHLFTPKKVFVPIDGSDNAARAAGAAMDIAKKYGSTLVVLSVIATPKMAVSIPGGPSASSYYEDIYEANEAEGKRLVQRFVDEAKSKGIDVHGEVLREASSTVDEIVKSAENKKADLIVVGTRGLGGFKRLLLGSVSSGVVTHAHCSVLVVR